MAFRLAGDRWFLESHVVCFVRLAAAQHIIRLFLHSRAQKNCLQASASYKDTPRKQASLTEAPPPLVYSTCVGHGQVPVSAVVCVSICYWV